MIILPKPGGGEARSSPLVRSTCGGIGAPWPNMSVAATNYTDRKDPVTSLYRRGNRLEVVFPRSQRLSIKPMLEVAQ